MSFINRMRPCPCRSRRCRIIYAAKVLIIAGNIGQLAFLLHFHVI
jgi:hypothetical protein